MSNYYPNLFDYATKELSQDAFIAWLMSFAYENTEKHDSHLVLIECAKNFLREFLSLKNEEDVSLSCLPQLQYNKIDVLLSAKTKSKKYKIIIEDKIFSSDHDDQLQKYYQDVTASFESEGYITVCIYFKPTFPNDLSKIEEKGYKYFGRKKILEILKKYVSKTYHNVFHDYYNHLNDFDKRIGLYQSLPLKDWDYEQVMGFFEHLSEHIIPQMEMKCGYGYIDSPSGGFYGMWIYWPKYKTIDAHDYELYLQLEFKDEHLNICYKSSSREYDDNNIKLDRKKVDSSIREKLSSVNGKSIPQEYGFNKPPRYGCGFSSTIGIYKCDETKGYEDAEIAIINAQKSFCKMADMLLNSNT